MELSITDIKKHCNIPLKPFIVEIGAHYGEDSIAILDEFPDAMLHVFEPDPRCIVLLQQNLGNHPRCKIHECAISDKNEIVDWYQSGGNHFFMSDWDASSSVLKPTGHLAMYPTCKFDNIIKVQTATLDSFLFESIDFLRMDVQGAEHLVFNGATETLKKTRYIYTEFATEELYEGQKNLQELCSMLPNFKPIGLFNDNGLENILLQHVSI